MGRCPTRSNPKTEPAERSLPNQNGTPFAKTDRPASPSHLGGPSSWRGSKTFQRAAGASARSASGAPRTLSRARHLSRRGWNLVSQGRQDLRGSEPRARRFQPRLISSASLLRPVRPHPPHRRGRRRPSACAWPAGSRRSLRQGHQSLLPSPRPPSGASATTPTPCARRVRCAWPWPTCSSTFASISAHRQALTRAAPDPGLTPGRSPRRHRTFSPVVAPRTWLASVGWRRAGGPIDLREAPRSRPTASVENRQEFPTGRKPEHLACSVLFPEQRKPTRMALLRGARPRSR